MKNWLFLLAVVVPFLNSVNTQAQTCRELFSYSAAAKVSALPYEQRKDFTFMTWNMLSLLVSDGVMKPGETVGRFVVKTPNEVKEAGDIIKKAGADILVAEETEINSLKRLDQQVLKDAFDEYGKKGNDSAGIEIGFLVLKSLGLKGEIESHVTDTWLNITMNPPQVTRLFARDLPVLRLWKMKANGSVDKNEAPALIVIGAHFKSKRNADNDPESYVWRLQHGLRTYQILTDLERQYNGQVPIIMGGDFNDVVNGSAALRPIGLLLNESFSFAGRVGEEYAPYNATHTYHPKKGPMEAHQMDGIFMNDAMATHMTESSPFHYLDSVTGTPKLYPKFNGNAMDLLPYPNTFKQREGNPSDHKPALGRFDNTQVNPAGFQVTPLRQQFLALRKNFLEQVQQKTGSIDSDQQLRVRLHLEEGKSVQDLPSWLHARFIRDFIAPNSAKGGKSLDLQLREVDMEFYFLSSIVFGDLKYISRIEVL